MLPVINNSSRASIVASTHKRSFLWDDFVELTLEANMRVRGSDEESFSVGSEWF